MSKKSKILIIVIVALVSLLTFLEASQPEELNWFPSYAKTDKIPLGTYVFHDLLTSAKEKEELREVNLPPYELLTGDTSQEFSYTYLFINETISFDEDELNKLLDWTSQGNTLFISAKRMSSNLLDTLHLKTNNLLQADNLTTQPIVNLTHTKLKKDKSFLYDRDTYVPYFSEIDTSTTVVLGYTQLYEDSLEVTKKNVNFIKQGFGQGKIILHTLPEVFTNYFILKNKNYQYTEGAISYINPNPELDSDRNTRHQILWDNYYKAGKKIYTSPLYFLLSNRYLRWGYYTVLIAALLFIIFEGKRKQRAIPVIEPLKNQTLAFVRTISGMYYEKQQHKEIAIKQNVLFLDYVRSVLRVPTDHLDEKTLKTIAARSNNDLDTTKTLFTYFKTLNTKTVVTKEELFKLHKLISDFKNKV